MIDFLKKCGLNDIEIKEIEEINGDFNLYNLSSNEFDVIKMIDYYTNQSFTIKEIESFKGVHPKFWSEFMK